MNLGILEHADPLPQRFWSALIAALFLVSVIDVSMLVQPNEDVYVDILLMDASKCDPILRPNVPKQGRPEFAHDFKLKSLICKPGTP